MFNMSTMYDWDHGIVNRNFNILQQLQKENKINRIISVDFFPVTFAKAVKHYFQNILFEIKNADMVYGDLTSACYQKNEKVFVYTSIDSIFSWKTVARELRRIEKALNLRNIIFWSFNPMFVEFIGKLNEKLFIFDAVDNWAEHPVYPKIFSKKRLLNNYKTIADKADLIFTVSKNMQDFFVNQGRAQDTYWVPNGVDWDHFNSPQNIAIKTAIDDCPQKVIGYVGVIENRFDIDLIAAVADYHQDKIIVLCGPIWKEVEAEIHQKLRSRRNIILTGRVNYESVPAYMNRFNVAIIPHRSSEFVESMNPMKLYEYFAAGKPIVSTPVAGLEIFESPIYIARDTQEFCSQITNALNEDSELKKDQRRQEARRYSWRSRVDDMIDYISLKIDWPKH